MPVLKEYTRNLFHELKISQRVTCRCLDDPSGPLRIGALLLVKDYWGPKGRFVHPCLRLAFQHPDSLTRGLALRALGRLQALIDDPTGQLYRFLSDLTTVKTVTSELVTAAVTQAQASRNNGLRLCETKAGPLLQELLRAPGETIKYFWHPESRLRHAALALFAYQWQPNEECACAAERIVLHDSDLGCRRSALLCLSMYYQDTDDARIGKTVSEIVTDRLQPDELRRAAYEALFRIRGIPVDEWPLVKYAATGDCFRFPDDVDWRFVKTFVEEAKSLAAYGGDVQPLENTGF